ncbi:hypothetical protein RUND412_010752 [Rhizina undulata]
METQNANPTILTAADLPTRHAPAKRSLSAISTLTSTSLFLHDPFSSSPLSDSSDSDDDEEVEEIDAQEIYDLISPISDPEHPLTLGELAVVNLPHISILPPTSSTGIHTVLVEITPTITHCSLATVIGLGVRVRLERALPPRYRVDVRIREGTHTTAGQVNRQLADKERVASALENETLMGVVGKMLEGCR